jgi:hypothetical protein
MRDAQAREEKFKDGLASADESIKATNERIRMLEHSNNILYGTGNQGMTAQEEWRRKYEEKAQKLREVTQKYKELEQGAALEKQKREGFHSQER